MCKCPNGAMSYMGRPLSLRGSCILFFEAHKNGVLWFITEQNLDVS